MEVKALDSWRGVRWVGRMPLGWRLTIPEAYREPEVRPGVLVEVSLKPIPKPPKVMPVHYDLDKVLEDVQEAAEELHKALSKEPSKAVRIHGSGMIIRL